MSVRCTPRRKYQFTLRALVVGTTICAAALAGLWYALEPIRREAIAVERANQAAERVGKEAAERREQAIERARQAGTDICTQGGYSAGWFRVTYAHDTSAWQRLLCAICRSPGRVTEMSVAGDAPAREILRDLEVFGELRSLNLDSSLVADEDISRIASLRQLSTLKLGAAEVKGKGLAALGKLTSLRSLSVASHRLDDESLAAVAQCRQLDDLTLEFSSQRAIDPRSFAHLRELPRLESLWISHGITDAALREIATLPHLWQFTFYSWVVTDRGVEHLRGNKNIAQLSLLRAPEVTDESLGAFASMTGLKELALFETQISAAGCQSLAASRPDITMYP